MDDLNEKDAATMMEICKTSLLAYLLKDPLDSHLPPLPIPAADLQDFVSTAEWKAKRTDTIMDWVLLHLAGAAGSRFWDKDGIRKLSTVPGFDDARITGLSSQRYIVVSGEISRQLQNASLDLSTAASLKHQGSSATPPLELIFTSAGKDCDTLVVLSIAADKRLAMLAFDPSTADAHAALKKNVKAAFGLSSTSKFKFTKSTVSASPRSMPTGDMSLNAARTASILFGGKHAATPRDAPRFMKVWIVTQILDSIKGTILSQK
jgi:hypothetical protein